MAYYGSRGRNFNVGLSSPELLPATKAQLRELQSLDRRDYSGQGLTREQAQIKIDEGRERKAESGRTLTQMEEGLVGAIWQLAIQTANKAGDAWVEKNKTPLFSCFDREHDTLIPVYGAIGTAWLTWPEKGSKLYKWLRERNFPLNKGRLEVPHHYQLAGRLEGELQFECYKAALNVLSKASFAAGVTLMMRSETENPKKAA
jgi:hypothetical protein